MLKVNDLRKSFLQFFELRDHKIIASSSLVPRNDPTLLFTNAGMVQFKNVFLGQEKRSYNRAATVQRCVRAGGKHNDLEKVGYTARHHTFFEMLGNFSFGDYFKLEAITYAWDFLTKELRLPEERFWITVYKDDDEAADIWLNEIGINPKRFSRMGEKDNFWAMGDTGPCGPCSEIFYDHGKDVPGGPPGSPNDHMDRFVEIWNLVFMQYNRSADGSLTPLPKPSVDTGMGLERLAAVIQGVHSNYDIDIFQNLLRAVAEVTGKEDLENKSLRVIADHIRSSSFLIADNVLPSNEGRGYVLRRIIRRAIRHGHKLKSPPIFFHNLVSTLAKEMGDAYPELLDIQTKIGKILCYEEEQFNRTLDNGMSILAQAIEDLDGKIIPGEIAFKLYDTYGFPLDLTADVAREYDIIVDEVGFLKAMEEQRTRGKSSWRKNGSAFEKIFEQMSNNAGSTNFLGYENDTIESDILVLANNKGVLGQLKMNERGSLVTKDTSFYGESGGQVGDTGRIISSNGIFCVNDTKIYNDTIIHTGEVTDGGFRVGDRVKTEIDVLKRNLIRSNHTATHLLQAALRMILGTHIQQSGSLVASERFRFDFLHFNPLTGEEIAEVERIVNDKIWRALPVTTEIMNIDEATAKGALAVFDEKYDEMVRVVSVENYSMELCGGTHVDNTGKIGVFKILKESSPGAGMRRIEAATLKGILDRFIVQQEIVSKLSRGLNVSEKEIVKKVEHIVESYNNLLKESKRIKSEDFITDIESLISHASVVGDVKMITHQFDNVDVNQLREIADLIRSKEQHSLVCFGSRSNDKAFLLCAATKKAVAKGIDCGSLVKEIAPIIGGGGGGRKDMAQAGGKSMERLRDALDKAENIAQRMIIK
ncbi:MAG: alanine--tRNA ligase [Spirochaetota bacterium]|nr:alanine--tRNA ligase [Spirochaetota bacterium]